MDISSQNSYQLRFEGLPTPKRKDSYRQKALKRQRWRVADKERLRLVPLAPGE